MCEVTISIPVYKAERYVERALLSALNQTFASLEILVVNDGSPDGSIQIVQALAQKHPRGSIVRIIHHPFNQGTGATKNTAIDHAQGKYLFFLDADDEILPHSITQLYQGAKESSSELCTGSIEIVDAKQRRKILQAGNKLYTQTEEIAWDFLATEKFLSTTWNKLYLTHFLRSASIRCPDHLVMEDPYFTGKLLLSLQRMQTINELTYIYFFHPCSYTGQNTAMGFTEKTGQDYRLTLRLYADFYHQILGKQPLLASAFVYGILRRSLSLILFAGASRRMTAQQRKSHLVFIKDLQKEVKALNELKKNKSPLSWTTLCLLRAPIPCQQISSFLFLSQKKFMLILAQYTSCS